MKFKEGVLPKKPEDRLRYLYRFQELLKQFHNIKAKEAKGNKSKMASFRRFQKGWFAKRNNFICGQINHCKDNLKLNEKKLLLIEEEDGTFGTVKYKVDYQNDTTIEINIDDLED